MIRYKKLGYLVLSVTDLEKSVDFYVNTVGLQFVERDNENVYLRSSRDHHNLILQQGSEPGLKRVGWELEKASQFQEVFDYLTEKGLDPVELSDKEAQKLAQGRTLRFKDPYVGITYEFYADIMQLGLPYESTNKLEIETLLHVVYESPHLEEITDFFVNTLNFKVSDFSGRETNFAWLRAFPNKWHHTFAVTKGPENKLNHLAYKVSRVDDIGIQVNRLNEQGVPILFGPGRHHPSGSIFLYFADPDGMAIEYSQGMEAFPEEGAREPRRLEPSKETIDEWGGTPQPEFGQVGALLPDDSFEPVKN